eukprot:7249236-Pyramimonas_sp.AAC.1
MGSIDQRGFRLYRHPCFGPLKWVNLYSGSSCLMVSKTGGGKKPSTTPCAGVDELNSTDSRRRIAGASNPALVSL